MKKKTWRKIIKSSASIPTFESPVHTTHQGVFETGVELVGREEVVVFGCCWATGCRLIGRYGGAL